MLSDTALYRTLFNTYRQSLWQMAVSGEWPYIEGSKYDNKKKILFSYFNGLEVLVVLYWGLIVFS